MRPLTFHMLAAELAGKASEHMPDWWRRIDEDPAWRSYSECVCSEACLICDLRNCSGSPVRPRVKWWGQARLLPAAPCVYCTETTPASRLCNKTEGRLAYTDVALMGAPSQGMFIMSCSLLHVPRHVSACHKPEGV